MVISKKLIKYLEENKYKYEIIEHRTTYTAWDTSQTEKITPREVSKTLVLKADREAVFAVIPADRNLDKKKFMKIFNKEQEKEGKKAAKKVDFAKEAWMKKNILGKVGATPPFHVATKEVKIFVDSLFAKNRKIYLGSGEYEASIRVGSSQYLKKERVILGGFSEAKKKGKKKKKRK